MIDKIINLLFNDSLKIETRKVILANYFKRICKSNNVQNLITNPQFSNELKIDMINLYASPLYRWEAGIRESIEPTLIEIVRNPNQFDINLVSASFVALSEFQNEYILDNIEEILTKTESIHSLYGPTVDYFSNMIIQSPFIINETSKKLALIINSNIDISPIASKILLDLIYGYYEHCNDYTQNPSFRELLLNTKKSINEKFLFDLINYFVNSSPCDSALLLDYNKNSKSLHFNYGAESDMFFNTKIISLEASKLLSDVISKTFPCFVSDTSDAAVTHFFRLFKISPDNSLIIPCLYFGEVESILVLVNCKKFTSKEFNKAFILAKYIAGFIYRRMYDLDLLNLNEKYWGDLHDIAIGLGHDINNPLLSLEGYLRGIDDIEIQEDCLCTLNVITEIVENIKAFTDPNEETYDVNKGIEIACNASKYLIHKQRIKLELNLDPKCPTILIPPGFMRVIQNILKNAIDTLSKKIDDPKVINIITEYINGEIYIRIKDNGTGVPKTIMDRIFEPYVSIDGMGIGLSLAKQEIERIGGEIRLAETSISGSTFEVIIYEK